MKSFNVSIKCFAIACLTLSLGSSCSKPETDTNILRSRLPGDPPTLDWNLAMDNVSREVINALQDGLLEQSEEAKVQPALAESWSVDKTGTVYEFIIRENAKWSDGQPVLAQHFVDSWERLLNPTTASEYAYFLFDVKGAEAYQSGQTKDFSTVGVKAVSDRKLVVELRHAASYWINIPTFWVTNPIRKDLIAKHGDKWTMPGNLVTSGAYSLKEWQRESRILLEKNPGYYDADVVANAPAKIEFRTVKEGSTAVTLFKGKQLDIVRDLPPVQLPTLSKMPEFQNNHHLRGYYIAFNTKDPLVSDVNVRKSIAMSINREELSKLLTFAIKPTKSWIPEGMLGYTENVGIDYNPEAAKKLWNSIKNKPQKIEIWFNSGEQNKIVAENVQSQVKTVLGLDLEIQIQEWKTYLKTLSSATPAMWRLGWGADYPDPHNFMDLFMCNSGNNFTKFCDSKYDKSIVEASGSSDPNKRVEIYTRLQKQLLEQEVAFIPLYNERILHLVSQRVKGFKVNAMGDFSFKRIRF